MVIGYIFWGLVVLIAITAIVGLIMFLVAHPAVFWVAVGILVVVLFIEATRR